MNRTTMRSNGTSHLLLALTVGFALTGWSINARSSLAQGTQASAQDDVPQPTANRSPYAWTTDHMQVGVRWQPSAGRPAQNAYDAQRPMIAVDSSYVQFWVSWPSVELQQANTNYAERPSHFLRMIETAVDTCVAKGLKVEFVLFHCPGWASVSGESGGRKPKPDHFSAFVTRLARHFKGRVHSYQLAHEANLKAHMQDGDIEYVISEIFTKGAQAIRSVYDAAPAEAVVISTSGCSPCHVCPTLTGLNAVGGPGINNFYDHLVNSSAMMDVVDALNLNVSDHLNGYGGIDDRYVTSTWANYDLARRKLDTHGYRGKQVMSAESWISWDDGMYGIDVNGDGVGNEQDAYRRTLTIMGQCLQRGLNTMNLPWSDNSSDWAMGLTKRRDYNGRVKELDPQIVIPANDGGADIITKKLNLRGGDANFTLADGAGNVFTVEDYVNPADPNHLHYYIWRWYAQLAGGPDEVIRHALAGEENNDITVSGPGYTGTERFRMSSYNRTRKSFLVLMYAGGADGTSPATVAIPSAIQEGRYYNNEFSRLDFRGEGFADGDPYEVRIVTKDISLKNGSDVNRIETTTTDLTVSDETLTFTVPRMNKFTAIEFIKGEKEAADGR